MTMILSAALAVPLALQAASAPEPEATETAPPAIASFDDLPIEQTTAPRCGIAFAVVEGLQEAGHPGAQDVQEMAGSGAREFFVQAMARLMEDTGLDREAVKRIVDAEVQRHIAEEGKSAIEMMPACLLLKDASGL